MPPAVTLVSDEDIPTCFQILSKSFGHDAPFVDILYPHHDTPSGQAQGSKRMLAWKQSSDESTFLKAVTDQGQMVGVAVWTYMKELPSADMANWEKVEEIWPDKEDWKFMDRLWRDYIVPRSQAITDSEGKGVYVLELLAVHPDHQRSGAGAALVQWGTGAADRQGLQAIVEGTPAGRRLYEKSGFHIEIETMPFDVDEEFIGKRKLPKLHFMKREPKA